MTEGSTTSSPCLRSEAVHQLSMAAITVLPYTGPDSTVFNKLPNHNDMYAGCPYSAQKHGRIALRLAKPMETASLQHSNNIMIAQVLNTLKTSVGLKMQRIASADAFSFPTEVFIKKSMKNRITTINNSREAELDILPVTYNHTNKYNTPVNPFIVDNLATTAFRFGHTLVHYFTDYIPEKIVERFKLIYDSVDDVDLFIGGISEVPVHGALSGPTFQCLVGDQFKRLQHGDRFYYDNSASPGKFTEEQLVEIRKSNLARVHCDNGDALKLMQPLAFRKPSIM